MKIKSFVVIGQSMASQLAEHMIEDSQFHAVMPLPDDEWQFSIRPENFERYMLWLSKTFGPEWTAEHVREGKEREIEGI